MWKEIINAQAKVYTKTGKFKHFFRDVSGATAIEYALICVGIALVIIVAVNAVGNSLVPVFDNVSDGLLS